MVKVSVSSIRNMKCVIYDLEIMDMHPGQIDLGVPSTSVTVIVVLPKPLISI